MPRDPPVHDSSGSVKTHDFGELRVEELPSCSALGSRKGSAAVLRVAVEDELCVK